MNNLDNQNLFQNGSDIQQENSKKSVEETSRSINVDLYKMNPIVESTIYTAHIDLEALSYELKIIIDDLFEYNDFECKKLYFKNYKFHCNDIYYCLEDIITALGFTNFKDKLNLFISQLNNSNKFTIYDLYEKYASLYPGTFNYDLNSDLINSLNKNEMEQIYISELGLYEIVNSTYIEESYTFKDFINKKLLPMLKQHYEFIIYKQKLKIDELNQKINLLLSI